MRINGERCFNAQGMQRETTGSNGKQREATGSNGKREEAKKSGGSARRKAAGDWRVEVALGTGEAKWHWGTADKRITLTCTGGSNVKPPEATGSNQKLRETTGSNGKPP